jgi:uncharacterized HAD superfamily protein
MKIVFDIDGVTRDMHGFLEKKYNFKITHWNYIHDGKDFWDMAREYPEIWLDAPVTEYYDIIKKQSNLEFWTVQKPEFKELTWQWLDKHFSAFKVRFFKDFQQKHKAVREDNVILIDDFPLFPDYYHILLIDRGYNQKTKPNVRIKTPKGLEKYLKQYEGNK